jgi:23S rRNA (guanine745-N1)-methyltransferase
MPLACTVRNCGRPLARRDGVFACPQRHSYDVARRGYINLLQPQDRRSPQAGDSEAARAARARLSMAGVGRSILNDVVTLAATLALPADPVVADLGCGDGEALGALAQRRPIAGVGIDLSTAAVETAAQRFPALTWVVANVDRRVPLLSHRVHLALSVHARRNPAECARVLSTTGFLLLVVPAPDDLIELRAGVQGRAIMRDRSETVLRAHQSHFAVLDRFTFRERHRLDHDALLDLLRGTYRGARASMTARIGSLDTLDVTLASDVLLFTAHGRSGGTIARTQAHNRR